MIEHRLIERMIAQMARHLETIEKTHVADPGFVIAAVDFIRTYADRTHHGKEEDILFRDLAVADVSQTDMTMMNELIEEHVLARKTTAQLVEANNAYVHGDEPALAIIVKQLEMLVDFYPRHIAREDDVFFPAAMKYLSDAEQQTMLDEFWRFDREMIHNKYRSIVEQLEQA